MKFKNSDEQNWVTILKILDSELKVFHKRVSHNEWKKNFTSYETTSSEMFKYNLASDLLLTYEPC